MPEILQSAQKSDSDSESRPGHPGPWSNRTLRIGFHQYVPNRGWTPAINLYEDVTQYCLLVDLAGVRSETMEIRADDLEITIAGRRESPAMPMSRGEVRMHLMEVDQGPFIRTVEFLNPVDPTGISATYQRGYLWIHIPKRM